jgi:hexosaminidase
MFYLIRKILTLFTLVTCVTANLSIWPYPSEISTDGKCIAIDSGFSFISNSDSTILTNAFERYKKISLLDTKVSQPCSIVLCSVLSKINVIIESLDETLGPNTNETYSLVITNTRASITGASVYGAVRGLETFSQIIFKKNPSQSTFYLPLVNITDYPRFGFRAILIDTSRLFRPVYVLKEMLDAMAWSKFNMLILHLTDDQGWTIEIKSYPNLTIKCLHGTDNFHPPGSVRYYTQNDMKELVNYAKNRGIRVIAEIDNPGHIDILKNCYPELLAKANCPAPGTDANCRANITKSFRSTPDISNPKWWEFYKNVVRELKTIFFDPYFSIGGDEFWEIPWKYSPSVQQFLLDKK